MNQSTDLVRPDHPIPESETEAKVFEATLEFRVVYRRTLQVAVTLGEALIEHREFLGHGKWLDWLDARFDLGKSMAYNLISIADPENFQFIGSLPAGTGVTEAIKALRVHRRELRGPRPLPEVVIEDGQVVVDGEVIEEEAAAMEVLLRFTPPDTATSTIVRAMVLTFFPDAQACLDTTYGGGNFWSKPLPLPVTAHDRRNSRAPDGVMDFTDLAYEDASFDLVVFDPPHLASQHGEYEESFDTVETQAELEDLIEGGVRECWRVCSKGIIVKVTDNVHGSVFNDMSLLVCDAVGSWPYDKVYQTRSHAMIGWNWNPEDQFSAFNNGSTYLVFRKGSQSHKARSRS